MRKSVVITATHAVESVQSSLSFWIAKLGMAADIQVHENLRDPVSLVQGAARGFNVVLLQIEGWLDERLGTQSVPFTDQQDKALADKARVFADALQGEASHSRARHLVCICPPSAMAPTAPAFVRRCQAIEELFAREFADVKTIELLGCADLLPQPELGAADSAVYFATLGTLIARRLHRALGRGKRVMVLGCSAANRARVPASGVGQDEFKHWILSRRAAGLTLCLVAEREAEVDAAFQATGLSMSLGSREPFAFVRLGSESAAAKLELLAAELQLPLDEFVYIDGDVDACSDVAAKYPEVLTLALPHEQALRFLANVWVLDGPLSEPIGEVTARTADGQLPWRQVAAELYDGAQVVQAMKAADLKIRDRYVFDTPFVAPRNQLEEQLATMWMSVLGVDRVGVDDNFFDLGGDSLLETHLLSSLKECIPGGEGLRSLFDTPTIASMVQGLSKADAPAQGDECIVVMKPGAAPWLFLFPAASGQVFPYLALARGLGGARGIQALRSPDLQPGAALLSLDDVVNRYVEAVRRAQPAGPYLLAGWSYGSILAFEAAKRLTQSGGAVATVLMLDPPPPRVSLPAALGAARFALALSWFALHAPRLGRALPKIGRLLSTPNRLQRFMLSLPLQLSRSALARMVDFVLGGAGASIDRGAMSDDELCDLLVDGVKQQASEAEMRRYFIPGLSSTELIRAAQVWKHDLLLGFGYRAGTGVMPFRIDVFVTDEAGDDIKSWAEHSAQRFKVRRYPIRPVGELSAHLAFVEPDNVSLYAPDLLATLVEAEAVLAPSSADGPSASVDRLPLSSLLEIQSR
jgi:pimeloyl-ACP methyl ester carboxylesterase